MCGLAGLWNVYQTEEAQLPTIRKMVRSANHRGPEAEGFALGAHWAIGHARLAIIDIDGGQQPIWSRDGNRFVVGNNEIYNAPELRKELRSEGYPFATRSDTEVVLVGWEAWGEDVFKRLNGMFAIALVDVQKKTCLLARDPLGIKPLHYVQVKEGYAFASEIKSLWQISELHRAPNWDAIHLFMNFRYVPDNRTLFSGIQRLPPGSFATLSEGRMRIQKYFSLRSKPEKHIKKTEEVKDALIPILRRAVRRHLVSDVEVASYLSGGIDSSIVSRLASEEKAHLKTYCVAFGEPTDENSDARKVAQQIQSTHEDIFVGARPLDHFKEILWQVEEPKINCVQGFLLAEQVSKNVKVALSGLGGDELFAGYVNNDILYPMTKLHHWFPKSGLGNLGFIQKFFPNLKNQHFFRVGELGLNLANPLNFYAVLRNSFDHNPFLLKSLYANPPEHWRNLSTKSLQPFFNADNADVLNELLLVEVQTKMVNDFLLTEDRVSMAHSLEVRVPLLDLELVRFAFSLPSSVKYQPGQKKSLLKKAAEDWLSPDILNKKKWGFSFNPHLFYQGQLKSFAQEVLTKKSVTEFGLFNWKWIDQLFKTKPHPRLRWHYFNLWVMVGFHLWFELFFGNKHADLSRSRI